MGRCRRVFRAGVDRIAPRYPSDRVADGIVDCLRCWRTVWRTMVSPALRPALSLALDASSGRHSALFDSKTRRVATRPSGTSVRYRSDWLEKLGSVSTEPAAAHAAARELSLDHAV